MLIFVFLMMSAKAVRIQTKPACAGFWGLGLPAEPKK
jgi:hypothetical protein